MLRNIRGTDPLHLFLGSILEDLVLIEGVDVMILEVVHIPDLNQRNDIEVIIRKKSHPGKKNTNLDLNIIVPIRKKKEIDLLLSHHILLHLLGPKNLYLNQNLCRDPNHNNNHQNQYKTL